MRTWCYNVASLQRGVLAIYSMKKKSASRSAFFNIRVLIGVFIIAAGALLALASSGVFSVAAQSVIQTMTQVVLSLTPWILVPVGFDCSKVYEMGIDKQENFRAGAIVGGLRRGTR